MMSLLNKGKLTSVTTTKPEEEYRGYISYGVHTSLCTMKQKKASHLLNDWLFPNAFDSGHYAKLTWMGDVKPSIEVIPIVLLRRYIL